MGANMWWACKMRTARFEMFPLMLYASKEYAKTKGVDNMIEQKISNPEMDANVKRYENSSMQSLLEFQKDMHHYR